ncbi:E3 ubiquitin-protein ligase bre1 [Podila minutissima]|uniref:E3 ubiquitin protein ligase n=1 Tax=Podila minutissima TaxID=64525 RepID=A0A9P5SC67_9FUNG|nr:E3 ubiquitin-protein ligase bre1 [Podila minutissima]
MEDRSIRKRRLTDEAGLPGQMVSTGATATNSAGGGRVVSPSPKKRQFTGSENSSPRHITNHTSKEDAEPMTAAEEVLANFQKEAIWRQMQEYKREHARAIEHIEKLQGKQVDYEAHLSTVDIYWNKLLEDLKMLMSRVNIEVDTKDMVLSDGTSFASFILNGAEDSQEYSIKDLTVDALKPSMEARSEYTKEVVLKLLRIIEEWSEQRDIFWFAVKESDPAAKESAAVQTLTQEHEKIVALYKKGQTDLDRLQAKCHGFTDQVLRLKNELEMTKNRLEETAENLDDSKERLRRVEKNMDREKSAIVSAVTSGSIFGENYTGSPDAATPSAGQVDSKHDLQDGSRDELLQFRELAVSRLAELEEMKTQRIQLKSELDQLKIQLNNLPDDKIQDSQHVKNLLTQWQYAKNDAEHYRNEASKLGAELDELKLSRRKFMESLETEEKNRRATLEGELKKLESDISRVRDSRDRFQQMYEARCTKDDYEMQQNQEIRKIANTRKDRITTLATDIQRLQIMLAANTGDKDAFAFYLNGPNDKSFLDDMRNKLRNSEEHVKALTIELEAYKEAASEIRELEAVTLSEHKLRAQVEELTASLAKMEALIGSEAEDPVKALRATIKSKDEAIQILEAKVQAHEAVQAPLLNELHTVATAWGQLEEATSRKVIDLAQKEDLIYKLLSDKTRQESKCNLLIRAKDASANMTAVMKRQSDMQLDQIRRLEEREKNLNIQMATLEREQMLLNNSVIQHKGRLQEYTQQNASFKDKFTRQEERLAELQNLLKERTEAYENEAHARKRLLEESEQMKRKIEEHAKAESTGDNSEAAKQAARYLKLLKCPACDVNFKSHVILRCMHVFCKSCMDNQMEYRQRKCPTCRENFGAKDVKEIYL